MALPVSIGDFLAITYVIKDVVRFVRSAAHAPEQLRALKENYEELMRAVCVVHLSLSLDDSSSPRVDVMNGLEIHASKCREIVDKLVKCSEKFNDTFSANKDNRSFPKVLKVMSRKVQWETDGRKEFERLCGDLEKQVKCYKLYAESLYGSRTLENTLSIKDFAAQTNNNFQALLAMFGDIPKELGYSWECGSIKAHVILTDALGEECTVPIDLCGTFNAFHEKYITPKFRDCPGEERVSLYEYRIFDVRTGQEVDLHNQTAWRSTVRPGSKLMMSLLLGAWERWMENKQNCPRCCSEDLRSAKFQRWLECQECGLIFEVLDETDMQILAYEPTDTPWPYTRPEMPAKTVTKANRSENNGSFQGQNEESTSETIHSEVSVESDREDRFKRVSIAWSPIFRFIVRQSICRCKLGEDPGLGPPIDLPVFDSVCRIHAFDEVKSVIKTPITQPEHEYDPTTDEYFLQFGGYLSFALWVSAHPVAQRSIDVRKLLSMKDLEKAQAHLSIAVNNEEHYKALKQYNDELAKSYLEWKSKHGKEAERQKAKLKPNLQRRTSI